MARTAYEIPLTADPQVFAIALAGVTYSLTLRWNTAAECWFLDIADRSRQTILSGVPVVTGLDLLAQYEYLELGGMLVVQTDHDADAVPTLANLGTTSHVYFLVEDAA